MIQVRLVFQAKFGKAADLVALFKEFGSMPMASGAPEPRSVHLFTDLSGPYDTVVQELEFDSFDAWEKSQAALFASPQVQAMMARSSDLIVSGYKEFFTIEA
jgi:hypothetical protein